MLSATPAEAEVCPLDRHAVFVGAAPQQTHHIRTSEEGRGGVPLFVKASKYASAMETLAPEVALANYGFISSRGRVCSAAEVEDGVAVPVRCVCFRNHQQNPGRGVNLPPLCNSPDGIDFRIKFGQYVGLNGRVRG
jgi:hypothetical protein